MKLDGKVMVMRFLNESHRDRFEKRLSADLVYPHARGGAWGLNQWWGWYEGMDVVDVRTYVDVDEDVVDVDEAVVDVDVDVESCRRFIPHWYE